MKYFVLLFSALFIQTISVAQESTKVSMKITYKGNPLCFWDVTLKHGDVAIGQGKTDDKGFVSFGYVRLLSNQVDASGYKKTPNGDKSWDVKGYIVLNDQGHADFDFQPLVEEMGMGSMLESAWGLTLNDCVAKSTPTNTQSETGNNTTSNTGGGTTSTETTEQNTNSETTNQTATVDPAQGYENQRAMYQQRIESLNNKIEKKKQERTKYATDSKEYSELTYDIMELEIDRDLTQIKLEKTEKSIANGYAPLNKTDREYYNQREEELEAKRKSLKEQRESGARADGEVVEDEYDAFEVYTAEQITEMGTVNLKKLRLEFSTKLGKRKTVLKTRGATMNPEKKEQLEKEIEELDRMITLIDNELAKRKETE